MGEIITFAGYGFGGRPVDDSGKFLYDILDYTAKLIPDDRLKFALGIGSPLDIVRCYKMGWNMFDCVIPTREGRHGKLYQFASEKITNLKNFYKEVNIKNSKNLLNFKKISKNSKIDDLKSLSVAYLYHLFKLNEALGHKLASLNNLEFYANLINKLRQKQQN